MEGLKSGYKHGNLMKNEIELRLPASNNFCTNILKKQLQVNLTIHSMSNKKMHGLHNISFSHAKTFQLLDQCIFKILQDNSATTLFECLLEQKNLLISIEKQQNKNKITIFVINAFHLRESQYKKRIDSEFHIDNAGIRFKIIKIS